MIVDEIGENIGAVLVDRDKYPLPDGWKMVPISLTEEWLERLGFKGYRLRIKSDLESVLRWNGHGVGLICNSLYQIGKDCRQVHQLQNLYFSLTGEELTIKQPI